MTDLDPAKIMAPIKQRLSTGDSLMPYDMRALLRIIDDQANALAGAREREQRVRAELARAVTMPYEDVEPIVAYLVQLGGLATFRQALIYGDALNRAMGASARRMAERRALDGPQDGAK